MDMEARTERMLEETLGTLSVFRWPADGTWRATLLFAYDEIKVKNQPRMRAATDAIVTEYEKRLAAQAYAPRAGQVRT